MTPMQTKQDNKQKSLENVLKVFYKADDALKKEILISLIMHYPDQYQEFVENMDKKTYNKIYHIIFL